MQVVRIRLLGDLVDELEDLLQDYLNLVREMQAFLRRFLEVYLGSSADYLEELLESGVEHPVVGELNQVLAGVETHSEAVDCVLRMTTQFCIYGKKLDCVAQGKLLHFALVCVHIVDFSKRFKVRLEDQLALPLP